MLRDRESGQSIIVIAMAVVALLALVALVVDVGNAYAHRRIVQNACDAGAMAGARRLAERGLGNPVLEIQVLNDIKTYAEKNGLNPDVVRAWFIDRTGERLETVDPWLGPAPGDAEGVEVAGDLPFTTYFAHMLGFPEMTASTVAKAWVLYGPCSGDNLFPVTVSTGTFTETTGAPEIGHVYTIWDKENPNAPGNWGWLYWEDDSGTNHCPDGCPQNPDVPVLGDNIIDTSRSGGWSVGDWVHGHTGVNMNPILDEIAPYIQGDPWPEVIIPLYDQIRGTGNNTLYRISGFAAFRLRCAFNAKNHYVARDDPKDCAPCIAGGSNAKCIRGEFVRMIIPSGQDGCVDTGISMPSFRKPLQSP
jgi:hypothetical protein